MKKDIATTQEAQVPAKATAAKGFEDTIDQSDLLIPRAKKLEAMSPEVQDNDALKAGMVINSVTSEVLPDEFVPVFFFKQWMRFNPRDSKDPNFDSQFGPGDMIYRITDGNDPRLQEDGKWHGETPPVATAFINFFSYFPGVDMPIIVSFCNTSYKTGRKLLSLARFGGGDMFSKRYKLTTKRTQNDKGSFYVLDVSLAGMTSEEDLAVANSYFDNFRGKEVQVHQDADAEGSEKIPF